MKKNNDCTVLISSCDKYKDCWQPMFYSLQKYWPDCPYEIKFVTNNLSSTYFDTIRVGNIHNWTKSTEYALKQVNTSTILWLLEDYWLTDYVNTKTIQEYVNYIKYLKADHIRLIPSEDIKKNVEYCDNLGVFKDDAPYRCSLNAGLWYVPTFLNLLKDEEFIWDFETQASIRSRGNDRFLCVKKFGVVPYIVPDNPDGLWNHHAVDRGKWTESAKLYAKKEGLEFIDFSKNPREDLQ